MNPVKPFFVAIFLSFQCGLINAFFTPNGVAGTCLKRSSWSTSVASTIEMEDMFSTTVPSHSDIERISLITDDEDRRLRFELFLCKGIQEEVIGQIRARDHPSFYWKKDVSPFVDQAQNELRELATEVQNKEWDKYITSECQPIKQKSKHLWACVDMTVQMQKTVRDMELQLSDPDLRLLME